MGAVAARCATSSRIKGSGSSSSQDSSLARIPDGTDAEVDAAVAIPVAVDAQTAPIEVADADPVATGVHVLTTDVDAFIQALAHGQEQHDGGEHDVARPQILFALRDQPELLLVGLGGGVVDGLLAEQEPPHLDRRVRERLALVPGVAERAVEQLRGVALHVLALPDVVDGHREARDEHVGVSAGAEHLLGERNLRELRAVTLRVLHTEGLLDLVDAEEVAAHDGPCIVIRLGHGKHPF